MKRLNSVICCITTYIALASCQKEHVKPNTNELLVAWEQSTREVIDRKYSNYIDSRLCWNLDNPDFQTDCYFYNCLDTLIGFRMDAIKAVKIDSFWNGKGKLTIFEMYIKRNNSPPYGFSKRVTFISGKNVCEVMKPRDILSPVLRDSNVVFDEYGNIETYWMVQELIIKKYQTTNEDTFIKNHRIPGAKYNRQIRGICNIGFLAMETSFQLRPSGKLSVTVKKCLLMDYRGNAPPIAPK